MPIQQMWSYKQKKGKKKWEDNDFFSFNINMLPSLILVLQFRFPFSFMPFTFDFFIEFFLPITFRGWHGGALMGSKKVNRRKEWPKGINQMEESEISKETHLCLSLWIGNKYTCACKYIFTYNNNNNNNNNDWDG